MKTTEMFARNNRDTMRKALRKFTVKNESVCEDDTTIVSKSIELVYKHNNWYSVTIDEVCNDNICYGNLYITLYQSHPEWGASIIAEEDCHYKNIGERTEIIARELIECIGIIELD